MQDSETKKLDSEILAFIRKYAGDKSSDEAFEALALKIFEYQYRRNVLYRCFCHLEQKKPGVVRRWRDVPAMPTRGFKELVLTTFPREKAIRIFKTSGTTNQKGARGAHWFDTLRLYEAAVVPFFKKFLLSDATRMELRFLISPPQELPKSSLSFMMGVVKRRFSKPGAKFYVRKGKPLFETLASDLKYLRSKTILLSTALALKGFLDYLKRQKIYLKLPSGSRLMETGGFKGASREVPKAALYAECQKLLGIPMEGCVSEYGMTELSSQFYRVGLTGFFQGPAWTRSVVIDASTGKEALNGKKGLLRHFDLANRGSVMAIQTEDLGRTQKPSGFELLGRAPNTELRGCSLSYEEFVRQ